MRPFLIGISGGTAAGKSLVCRRISEQVEKHVQGTSALQYAVGECITVIRQESFYKDVDAATAPHNFDHPDAFDFDLMHETLKKIHNGEKYSVSEYSYAECRKQPPTEKHPAYIVLVEGILAFYEDRIRSLFDMRIFVDCDADTRLASRVTRDVCERGRDLEHILKQYLDCVKPAFEQFVLPTKKYADVIIPRGAENQVAIEVIVQQTVDYLRHAQHENGALATHVSTPSNPASFRTDAMPVLTPDLKIQIDASSRRESTRDSVTVTTPPSAGAGCRLAPTLVSPTISPGKRARHTSESENANRRH